MREDDEPIVVEQTYNTPIDVVWRAITEIGQMRQWYFENIPSFEPVVGFETQFDVQFEDRHFLDMWKVTEVAPLKMIAYYWRYEGYPGDSFVMFELSKQDDISILRFVPLGTCDKFRIAIRNIQKGASINSHTLCDIRLCRKTPSSA